MMSLESSQCPHAPTDVASLHTANHKLDELEGSNEELFLERRAVTLDSGLGWRLQDRHLRAHGSMQQSGEPVG